MLGASENNTANFIVSSNKRGANTVITMFAVEAVFLELGVLM